MFVWRPKYDAREGGAESGWLQRKLFHRSESRKKQEMTKSLRLSELQHTTILEHFHTFTTQESEYGWSRRQYAPMHIHSAAFRSLREAIHDVFPEHTIAFDVVFEAMPHRRVDFHCDYESLGPFESPGVRDVFGGHFMSVHFNLTPNGGRLATLSWPMLSTLHAWVIGCTGIYSRVHRLLNLLCMPLFFLFKTVFTNEVGVGNAFDNMRLHMVSAGQERISYVVRLVKRGAGVKLSRQRVIACSERSSACKRLSEVLLPRLPTNKVLDAGYFEWDALSHHRHM